MQPRPGRLRSFAPAWLGRPEVALTLSLLCVADFYLIADRHPETPAGKLLNVVRRTPLDRDCGCGESIASIYDGPDGPRLLSDEDSADELTRLYATAPEHMYAVYSSEHDVTIGLIAPWWSRSPVHIEISGENDSPPPAPVESFARRTLKSKLFAHTPQSNVRFLADPDPLSAEMLRANTVWWGIGHDAAFLATSAFAAANVLCVPGYVKRRRSSKRLQRQECPRCRYSLSGLPPDTTSCPECGAVIPARGV